MGVFDTIAGALAGNTPAAGSGQRGSSGDPLNQTTKGGRSAQLQSGRDEMMAKMKALGLTTMPEGGNEQLDSMYAEHVRRYGAAAAAMR